MMMMGTVCPELNKAFELAFMFRQMFFPRFPRSHFFDVKIVPVLFFLSTLKQFCVSSRLHCKSSPFDPKNLTQSKALLDAALPRYKL
jgi:hypothetical protein